MPVNPRPKMGRLSTDYEKVKRDMSLDLMRRPENWPLWPALPLKSMNQVSPNGLAKLGFLLDLKGGPFERLDTKPFTVYIGPVYQYLTLENPNNPLDLPKEQYDSYQAVVDAGWVVD